jgi:hypothetical protein
VSYVVHFPLAGYYVREDGRILHDLPAGAELIGPVNETARPSEGPGGVVSRK